MRVEVEETYKDIMELFDALSLEEVPREENGQANVLVGLASTLLPCDELKKGGGKMEIFFRPSIPNNFECSIIITKS